MGAEDSNDSHDDQAGGEVQGTVCASSLFWSWQREQERGVGAVYGLKEPRERQVRWHSPLLRAPQQQVPWEHLPVGQKGGKASCHCATRQPLPCPNVCAHPSTLSLPTSLVPKEESCARGVLTASESLGAASLRAAAGGWYRQHPAA